LTSIKRAASILLGRLGVTSGSIKLILKPDNKLLLQVILIAGFLKNSCNLRTNRILRCTSLFVPTGYVFRPRLSYIIKVLLERTILELLGKLAPF
jgi:hypothetical protein